MKLTQEIKRMLNALAYATAGENLTSRQKHRVIAGGTAPSTVIEATSNAKPGAQIGFYLGSELSADVMQYVIHTCSRLKHGLTVLTFQNELDARTLLKPYQAELEDAHIGVQLTVLGGEPPAALVQALRKRPEIVFLICNESGYLGRSLMKGIVRQEAFPVPVVMVAANESAMAKPSQAESTPAASRAA